MSTLDRALRTRLADTIGTARKVAEEAVRDAICRLGVTDDEAPAYLPPDQKDLRVRLRAHARTLGDAWDREKKKLLETKRLEDAAAYEVWHRMLFGRFLVERGLLIHPDLGEPVDPSELADLAREEGEADPWALVERFAAPSLPAVFKPDDPVLAMTLDPALAKRLRDLVAALPVEVFTADDSLGWTYQFWRTAEKDAINRAGGKIGATELPAVTQLFTERYMVQFLLHNTLGAWWTGKVLAADPNLARNAVDEQELRDACALPGVSWDYLRFVREGEGSPWRPAAGSFPGWPARAAEITYCDPCCGSGHFLVEAFEILAALRRNEEGLSGTDAARAVLRDNLHGLEIDGRCVQIAAFNVALAAWKVAGGPVMLPQPHIAWVGAPPPMSRSEMAALANGDVGLRHALEGLHDQFVQAPLLGSLLEVGARDLLDSDLRERSDAGLAKLREAGPERAEGAIAARGLIDAAALLGKRYVLLATNVPFLGRSRQAPGLAAYITQQMSEAKTDLATAMLQRMRSMARACGTIAAVTPQNWLFLGGYSKMRTRWLTEAELDFVISLGPAAFRDMNWWASQTALVAWSSRPPTPSHKFLGIAADTGRDLDAKPRLLATGDMRFLEQAKQRRNPDARIVVHDSSDTVLLESIAASFQGIKTGDDERFRRFWWEAASIVSPWKLLQSTVEGTSTYGGRESMIHWEHDGALMARRQGLGAFGRKGVAVSQMRDLPVTIYTGEIFDSNAAAVIPKRVDHLLPLWVYLCDPTFKELVRHIDQALKVTNATLVKVPFDLTYWEEVAAAKFPDGLPEPYSDDPTQWLFHGHPAFAEVGTELHTALARLAGYRWPAETERTLDLGRVARERTVLAGRLPGVDEDGLLALDAAGIERSLADRLRTHLAGAYGSSLSPRRETELVRAADAKLDKREARDATIEAWLRDRAFRQHCVLFHQRPFLWQVWDGLRDGFSAFLHFHRLDHAALERLTFTLLGDWIAKARAEGRTAHENRALQLQQRLRAILEGEAPYDIFVRWKSLARQPIGWHPDLDDGVRLNIRPFMTAEVLREQPRITWKTDRGTDTTSAPWYDLGPAYGGKPGDRINDHHLTLAEKRAAQLAAKAS